MTGRDCSAVWLKTGRGKAATNKNSAQYQNCRVEKNEVINVIKFIIRALQFTDS